MKTIKLNGDWTAGYVLDKHVEHSYPLGLNQYGHMEYDTKRTHLGELVFQLKNRNIIENAKEIANICNTFLSTLDWQFDLIVAAPPSNKSRKYQPVFEIVKELVILLKKDVAYELFQNHSSKQIKNLHGEERIKTLKENLKLSEKIENNKNILILDDLYGTGSTLTAMVNVLKEKGHTGNIYVLAMTKTRG